MFPGGRGEATGGGGRCSMRPLPRHITALYLAMVLSCMVMFHVALVGADVLVYSQATRRPIEGMEFPDAPAHFGDHVPIEGIKGLLVYSKPAEACSPIEKPPQRKLYSGKWIVLIKRCGCTFEEKVRHAENAGFDAAIVHNVNSSDLEPMSANGRTNITIPSVFVGEDTGLLIKENYQYCDGYFIVINDNLPFNINTHLLMPFAIVVGICFLIMLAFMIVKCIKDRMHARRHRLSSSALKKIPTTRYKSKDPYETCAICLEDYLEGDKLRILPCSHAFHCKCIDPWLTCSRRECPMCKRRVFAHDERVPDDDDEDDDYRRNGDDEAPRNRPSVPAVAPEESDDERAPLIRAATQGRRQGRREASRGGGTFQQQRENPFRRAARRLRGTLSPSTPAPVAQPTATTTEDSSSTSIVTSSSGSFSPTVEPYNLPNAAQTSTEPNDENVQYSFPHNDLVAPAEQSASSPRMSVNSSPADIQDVVTLPRDAQNNQEDRQGDLVV